MTAATPADERLAVTPTANGTATAATARPWWGTPSSIFKHAMVKRPRPKRLQGATYRKDTPLGTAYITVNSDERNEPFEVFMNVGKAGTEVTAVSEAMGRLISLVLRMPARCRRRNGCAG
jgi:hypothetical protein